MRLRWLVLVAGFLLAVVGASWGTGVFGALISGGFDDPGSESAQASQRIAAELGRHDVDLVVLYSSETATVDDPTFRDPVAATLSAVRQRPEVATVLSYYDTHAPALVSADRHATYAAITLSASDSNAKLVDFENLQPLLTAPGITTQAGGSVAFQHTAAELTKQDITRGELLAMPALLILLLVIFRGLVAASLPLLIGGLAILGALTSTRAIATFTDVSTFAVNTITLLGLGMAIDYSLFVVNRFREELQAGHDTRAAIARTMATAGRTVLVSGLTIALALASLLIFPQVFLRSMAMGGIAAVLVAMLGALTVLPVLLALLGPRVNALQVPMPWRRRRAARPPVDASGTAGTWARVAHSVMRRPAAYAVIVLAVLSVLTLPFLHVQFGGYDERVMPSGTEAREVGEQMVARFPNSTAAPIQTFIAGASDEEVRDLIGQIRLLPEVTGAQVSASRGAASLVSVSYAGEPTGDAAYDAVRAIRELPVPGGVEVLVGGRPANDVDLLASLGSRLPWMALIMAAATLVLLFLAFGSVVLPVKAVLTNLISVAASFGVVVWVFQDGHLADWLDFTPTGFLQPTIPILILAVLFGLSTDYEVFLLSRVREAWDASGDNRASVAAGLQATGRIITAAALLLIVVVAGFTTGQISFTKLIGVGMLTAIVVDATLVRTLLVPATMRLLGRWNWWVPGALGKLYRRYGIRESAESEPAAPDAPDEPKRAALASLSNSRN